MSRTLIVVGVLVASLCACTTAKRSTVTCKAVGKERASYPFNAASGTTIAAAYPGAGEVLISAAAKDRIAVAALDVEQTGTGLLVVRVQFANCTQHDVVLRVRTQFLNAAGASSEDVSMWRDVFIDARGLASYRESAMNREARSMRVELDART